MNKQKIVIRSTLLSGSDPIIPDYSKELLPIDFPNLDAAESVDLQLHNFLLNKFTDKIGSIEQIFIPLSLTDDYLNFTGIRLAIHIRLTSELKEICHVPIVLMGYENKEDVCKYSNLGFFLFSKGVHLIKESKEEIESILESSTELVPEEYLKTELGQKIILPPPDFYDSRHSIANDWSLLLLDQTSGHNLLSGDTKISETKANLYIKWLLLKESSSFQDIQDPDKKFTFKGVKGKRILIIEDEWEKGWLELYDALFNDGHTDGAEVECLEISKSDNTESILSNLNDNLEREWDLFLLDIRLTDEDHDETLDFKDYSGFKILEKIKKKNYGNQVVLISASNKHWLYDYGKELGADDVLIKPDFNTPNQNSFLTELQQKITLLLNRGYFKNIYASVNSIKREFSFTNNSNNLELLSLELELKKLVELAADILRMQNSNSYEYATITLYKIIEAINGYFIIENQGAPGRLIFEKDSSEVLYYQYRKEQQNYIGIPKSSDIKKYQYQSTENKFRAFCFQRIGIDNSHTRIHKGIHRLVMYRNHFIHPTSNRELRELRPRDFVDWFSGFEQILKACYQYSA